MAVFLHDAKDILYQLEYLIWFAVMALFWDNVSLMMLIYSAIFLFHAIIAVPMLVYRNRAVNSRELVQHFFIRDVSPSDVEGPVSRYYILTVINRVLIVASTAYVIWYLTVYL